MWFGLGVVLLAVGIAFSIGWHELGHYSTARRFGIRVPEFMVGFGRTLWSRRIGETEFGLKVIPLGGYIRMIGMLPPKAGSTRGRSLKSSPFQQLVESARAESELAWQPGDETREFWTRPPWKRIIVMAAGPLMNLFLAAVIIVVALMTIGTQGTMTVSMVQKCMVSITQAARGCTPSTPPTPAAAAGLRAGDVVVSMGGVPYDDWETFRRAVRHVDHTVPLVVRRAGQLVTLQVTPVQTTVYTLDGSGATERGAFLGFSPVPDFQGRTFGYATGQLGDYISKTGQSLARLPARVPDLFAQVFLGEPRDVNTPISVVGASRLGGEVLGSDGPLKSKLLLMLQLLAGINLSMFLVNLLPVPPFDGGQILAAVWESVRRRLSRLRGRPDPGPVDLAKLMPVAYVVGAVFLCYSVLVVAADLINPLKLT